MASSRDIAFAQACAIGRKFPTFSLKTSDKINEPSESNVEILVRILNDNSSNESGISFAKDINHTIEYIRYS